MEWDLWEVDSEQFFILAIEQSELSLVLNLFFRPVLVPPSLHVCPETGPPGTRDFYPLGQVRPWKSHIVAHALRMYITNLWMHYCDSVRGHTAEVKVEGGDFWQPGVTVSNCVSELAEWGSCDWGGGKPLNLHIWQTLKAFNFYPIHCFGLVPTVVKENVTPILLMSSLSTLKS